MLSLSVPRAGFKSDFSVIADSFLHTPGLSFASVLDAESIKRVLKRRRHRYPLMQQPRATLRAELTKT